MDENPMKTPQLFLLLHLGLPTNASRAMLWPYRDILQHSVPLHRNPLLGRAGTAAVEA